MSGPGAVVLLVTGLVGVGGAAQDSPPLQRAFTLRTAIKASALISRERAAAACPCEPVERRTSGTAFWRLRLDAEGHPHESVTAGVGYEQRVRVQSASATLGGLGILPPDTPAPYRVRQLDWSIARSSGFAWRHEIDRAYVAGRLPRAELIAGRQAIGWGRGVLFGAVDLFSPFSPLEADREWRRGVDALRADVKIADRASLDTVAAFGETIDGSAFATRFRGYAGTADVEIVVGWRARDRLAGVTSSAVVGDAEAHGEVAVFRTPELIATSDSRTVVKAVIGASYRFPVGNGLLVYAEYHYSGFGIRAPRDIVPALSDPAFLVRYLRGDTQILGRHAVAVLGTEEFSPEFATALQWLHNPADGSGVVVPSATVTLGDRLSVVGTVYLPYGAAPIEGVPRSEYGSTPLTGFLQIRVYT